LLSHLARHTAEPTAARASRVSPLRPVLLARIDEHLDAHLGQEVPLAVLAQQVSMSVDHFVRAFHLATGLTPHQYIVTRRLDRACALLRESPLHVGDIAHACGFASPAHFSALFRRRHGVSPSAFRRLS
jgi:AraC family transcriptional regulator